MHRFVCALLFSFVSLCDLGADIAITHVAIVQPIDGSIRRDQTILIRGERIARIGHHIAIPANATVIEARGKYVIPGLWDRHVHLGSLANAEWQLAVAAVKGITGVRDMGTPLDAAVAIKRAVRRDHGTEVYICGPLLNGPLPFKTRLIVSVGTPAEAVRAVDQIIDSGADFIKVHDVVGAHEYDAISAECRKKHVDFAGHLPVAIDAQHAAASGQHSIEHLGGRFYGIMLACSREQGALTSRIRDLVHALRTELEAGKEPDDHLLFTQELTRPLAETFDEHRARALLALFREHDVWQCPTLVSLPLAHALANEHLSATDRQWGNALLQKMNQIIVRTARQNHTLLAGTDASLAEPKLHDELERLVATGISPLDALRAATINPARYFRITRDFGSVETGKVADLVVLDGNPLESISNTRHIAAVVLRGRTVPRS